jgi:polysaccharide biosynthesis transport protein
MQDPIVPIQASPLVPSETLIPDKQYYHAVTTIPIEEDSEVQQVLSFLRRRAWVILMVASVVMGGLGLRIYAQPSRFQGGFRLLVEPLSDESDQLDQSLGINSQRFNYRANLLDYTSQIEVLKSPNTLKPIVAEIQKEYPKFELETLMGGLSIKNFEDTKILDISYKARDVKQVEFVLHKLADGFIQYSVSHRYRNLQRGIQFVDKQVEQQRQEVSRLEKWIEDFRRKNDLYQPEDYAKNLGTQLTELLAKRRDLKAELAAAQTLNTKLQQQLGMNPSEAVVVSTLSEAPAYQDLIRKLRDIESQIALNSAVFENESPIIQDLQDQRSRLMPLLSQEAKRIVNRSEVARQGANVQTLGFQGSVGRDLGEKLVDAANRVKVLQAQDEALAITEQQLRQQTKDFAGVARVYNEVQRNLKISNDSLNRLLEARENLQLDRTRQTNPWELISEINQASIGNASGRQRQYILAAIAGLVIGLLAGWLADLLDQAYHTIDDLNADLKLPCLGQIPLNPKLKGVSAQPLLTAQTDQLALPTRQTSKEHYSSYYTSTSFLESFYSLYANIRLMTSDTPIKVLTIASASPGDGKSTVSSHLALAAAGMGYRVLLIDADLRWPRLHEKFNLPNLRGFSNLLTNDTLDLSELIHTHPNEEGLSLLTAGPKPPDPPRLLSSNRLRHLLDNLKDDFDLVIFDTPPLSHFVDGKLLASISDGTILVASLQKTDRKTLKHIVQELRTSINAPLLGCIANGIKTSGFGQSYSQYYQYYEQQAANAGS